MVYMMKAMMTLTIIGAFQSSYIFNNLKRKTILCCLQVIFNIISLRFLFFILQCNGEILLVNQPGSLAVSNFILKFQKSTSISESLVLGTS